MIAAHHLAVPSCAAQYGVRLTGVLDLQVELVAARRLECRTTAAACGFAAAVGEFVSEARAQTPSCCAYHTEKPMHDEGSEATSLH